jgi:hypothetical protein
MGTINVDKPLFSADDFLASSRPWDYMVSSSLSDPTWTLPRQELAKLHNVVNDLDEAHLVYTLLLAEGYAPELFAEDAARFLAHTSMSVRIKAYRVLRAVPAERITDSLREAVNKGLSECPEREDFADALSHEEKGTQGG